MIVFSALDLASKGFYIFPITEGQKAPPIFKDWQIKATRDHEQIIKWWKENPKYNIGIFTGRFGDNHALVVVDVDNKGDKKGDDEILKLSFESSGFPYTFEQKTPGGGSHFVYRSKESVKQGTNVLGNGLDIRSRGGYICGSGSVLASGSYTSDPRPVEPCPEWIINKCGRPNEKEENSNQILEGINEEKAKERAIEYLKSQTEIVQEGRRNDTLYKVAAQVKDLGNSREETLHLVQEYWHCEPPLDYEELKTTVHSVYKRGLYPVGVSAPETQFTPLPMPPAPEQNPKSNRRLFYKKFEDIEIEADFPQLIEGVFGMEGSSILYAPSNTGKSFIALDMAFSIATGTPWAGRETKQGSVIYIASEGGRGFAKRIKAIKLHHNLSTPVPFALVPCFVDLLDPKAHVEELISLIQKAASDFGHPVSLIIVDTLARAFSGGDENASTDMGAFISNIDKIGEQTKAHVMVIHHAGKDSSKGARGHSSLKAAVDTELEIDGQTVVARKQRDMETGLITEFELKTLEVGRNKSGKPITSCVVIHTNKTSAAKDFSKRPIKPETRSGRGLRILKDLLSSSGTEAPEELRLGEGTRVIGKGIWRERFIEDQYPDGPRGSSTAGFSRMFDDLIDAKQIHAKGDYVWI